MKHLANLAVRISGSWATISRDSAKGGGTTSFPIAPTATRDEILAKGVRLAKAIWPACDFDVQDVTGT
jgi:hypothetical protein